VSIRLYLKLRRRESGAIHTNNEAYFHGQLRKLLCTNYI